MKIQGKLTGDVVKVTTTANQSHDGQETWVDIEVGVSRENARKWFGEVFERVAFGSMVEVTNEDGETSPVHYQDSPKPGRKVVMETHEVRHLDHEWTAQPEIRKITTVQGEARVTALLRLPVDTEHPVIELLRKRVGCEPVTVEFTPSQAQFDFDEAREATAGVRAIDGTHAFAAGDGEAAMEMLT